MSTFSGDIEFDSNKGGNILVIDQTKLESLPYSEFNGDVSKSPNNNTQNLNHVNGNDIECSIIIID